MKKILFYLIFYLILSIFFSCTKFDPNNYPLGKDEKIVKGVSYGKEKLSSSKSTGYNKAFRVAIQQIAWSKWHKENNIITLELIPLKTQVTQIHREAKLINGVVRYSVYLKYKKTSFDKKPQEYIGYFLSDYSASVAYSKAIKNALSQYIDKYKVNSGIFKVKRIIQFEAKLDKEKINYVCKLSILCK